MRSYVITLTNSDESIQGALNLVDSAKKHGNTFNIQTFEAVIPEQVDTLMNHYDIRWNWPWETGDIDLHSGIFKQAYLTSNKKRRIACFLSHYKLWRECASTDQSLMIFEHDAIILKKMLWEKLEDCGFHVIGLNDPRRATRKSEVYHEAVQKQDGFCVPAPKIDMDNIAQGIAGNSAYYIKPEGAKKLIELVDEYGAWPNDAIMCRQLMPRRLGQVKNYMTSLQRMVSTTTT
tara:strand:+ start:965 stop:1663 length:699 start_codon:yes stop_codon:yes gene_type:complete